MWIAKLLELSHTMINPAPSRIMYFYKRWQPLYDEIMKRGSHIEFIQGIPHNIKDDDYFDTKFPTLFILDDQMRDSAKSSDICELFTEGSHHRNLSVICLMQNMFYQGKESRTMSLNTQYLVLFKSPRDKQQISILARQMYPNRSHYFIEQYEKATQRPHGYLFVDLKQSTSEEDRLKSDIFHSIPDKQRYFNNLEVPPQQTNEQLHGHIPPYGTPSVPDPYYTKNKDTNKLLNNMEGQGQWTSSLLKDEPNLGINKSGLADSDHSVTGQREDNMPDVCDDCGIVFDNTHALQRHVKRGCPEDDSDDEIQPAKRAKFELLPNWDKPKSKEMNGKGNNGVGDDDADRDNDDDVGFDRILNNVYRGFDGEYDNRVDHYMKKGRDKKEAISETDIAMRPKFRKGLIAKYKEYLTLTHELEKSRLHRDVTKQLQQSTNFKKTLKRVLKTSRPEFEIMLYSADESDDESSEEDEQISEDEEHNDIE